MERIKIMNEDMQLWKEEVTKIVKVYWSLNSRPDLLRDIVDHIVRIYPEDFMDSNQDELTIIGEAFEYLQTLCGDAVSSEDLEHMALTEKQQNIFNP